MFYIIGDTHGNWDALNREIKDLLYMYDPANPQGDADSGEREFNIIVCGDFGYWPKISKYDLAKIEKPDNVTIYFCAGNHEDWESLDLLGYDVTEVHKGIYYCPFGSIIELGGRTLLFCGGADSIDKHLRTPGRDWFANEIITDTDMDKLPDTEVYGVISHTCPSRILDKIGMEEIPWLKEKYCDPCCKQLDIVFEKYKPKMWHFGHFHADNLIEQEGCTFIGHDMVK